MLLDVLLQDVHLRGVAEGLSTACVHFFDLTCCGVLLHDVGNGGFGTTEDTSNEAIGHLLLLDEAHSNPTLVSAEMVIAHGRRKRGREGEETKERTIKATSIDSYGDEEYEGEDRSRRR